MRLAPARDEDGFAMIMAIVLTALVATLAALVLTTGTHTNFATGRGRSYAQALHVAEAGVQDAMVRLDSTSGAFSGTLTGTTTEGSYAVVVTKLPRYRYRLVSTGTVSAGQGLSAARKIRVDLAPPPSFKYALFSYTSVDTKNNDTITGDVWANQNVIVDENDIVDGSVTAATGSIKLRNGSVVTGDAWSGGYDLATTDGIRLEINARLDGSAKASVTAPTDPVTCGGESASNYTIRLQSGAVVGGSTTTWGSKTGPGVVGGAISNNICTAAAAAEPMPAFSYNALNYDAATLHEFGTPASPSGSAVADFQNWLSGNSTALAGTFTVFQSGEVSQGTRLDLTGVVMSADLTIITNVPIFTNGLTDASSLTDAILALASTYKPPTGSLCDVNQDLSECSIHLKNNFQPSGNTAVLAYAPFGPIAVKNNQVHFGAIYGDNIQIKNNQELTYDPRVERVVGFGPVTLEVLTWMELEA